MDTCDIAARKPLDGRRILVAGGGDPLSLGHAMSKALIAAGGKVAILDINEPALRESIPVLREVGSAQQAFGVTADISELDSVERGVAEARSLLDGLDVVFNCAGIFQSTLNTTAQNTWTMEPDIWKRMIAVNLTGAFWLTRTVIPHLIDQGWGRLIGLTTSLATMLRAGSPPYGPSKAGHEALIASVAEELDGSGVTANVLIPGGPTRSRMTKAIDRLGDLRLIEPEVMQAPAVWLASDESADFNGRRVVGALWDPRAPLEQRLRDATAPAAWPQAGQSPIYATSAD